MKNDKKRGLKLGARGSNSVLEFMAPDQSTDFLIKWIKWKTLNHASD